MFRAGGKEAEVEEVFRRIQAGRIPFDQVEIVSAAPEYFVLLWEKAQRHGWPLTMGPEVPVNLTRPARALLAFCSWIVGGFPAVGLGKTVRLRANGTVGVGLWAEEALVHLAAFRNNGDGLRNPSGTGLGVRRASWRFR